MKLGTYHIVLHDAVLINMGGSVRAYTGKGVVPRILAYTVGITVLQKRQAFLSPSLSIIFSAYSVKNVIVFDVTKSEIKR